MPTNNVDFSFAKYKRSRLFLKKTKGSVLPTGWTWECPCGTINELKQDLDQYCPKCGTRLRIQEQNEEGPEAGPRRTSFTLIRVAHFTVHQDGAIVPGVANG